MTAPVRLPDVPSLETVLAGLDPASADVGLIPALTVAFPGFPFGIAPIDGDDRRDARSIMRPEGSRLDELRPWRGAELAKENGDVKAVWPRLMETDLQITEWRRTSALVSTPAGPGATNDVQTVLRLLMERRRWTI